MKPFLNLSEFWLFILTQGIGFIFGCLVFISLFHLKNLGVHQVYFFKGVTYCFLAGAASSLVIITLKAFIPSISWKDTLIAFLLLAPLLLVFFTHIPVTADRSLSVFTLGHMDKHASETFSEKDLEKILINKYILDQKAMQKRITEQLASKNIQKSELPDHYQITEQGRNLMRFYRAIAPLFGVDCHLCGSETSSTPTQAKD